MMFDELLQSVDYESAILHDVAFSVGESILVVPLWKPWFCRLIIDAAEKHGGFAPLPIDLTEKGAAPGQELRISEFSPYLRQRWEEHLTQYIFPVISEFFRAGFYFKREGIFRDPFVVRYSMSTQTSMDEHLDASLMSFSVVLNDDFTGTNLVFPRQNWSNINVPAGWAVVFPGALTHTHYANELTSGVRYGLTGWIKHVN